MGTVFVERVSDYFADEESYDLACAIAENQRPKSFPYRNALHFANLVKPTDERTDEVLEAPRRPHHHRNLDKRLQWLIVQITHPKASTTTRR